MLLALRTRSKMLVCTQILDESYLCIIIVALLTCFGDLGSGSLHFLFSALDQNIAVLALMHRL